MDQEFFKTKVQVSFKLFIELIYYFVALRNAATI